MNCVSRRESSPLRSEDAANVRGDRPGAAGVAGKPVDIVIVGAGGFGRELHTWLADCWPAAAFRVKGYLGREKETVEHDGQRFPILADPEAYHPTAEERLVLAIGDVASRRRVVETIAGRGGQFLTVIHPTAVVAPSAAIGVGVIVYPCAVVANAACLEDFVVLNNYASAGHDSRIGRFSVLSPYATLNGAAALEEEVFMGTHSTVGPGVTIGRGSRISANSAALKDTPAASMVFGVPGKIVRRLDVE